MTVSLSNDNKELSLWRTESFARYLTWADNNLNRGYFFFSICQVSAVVLLLLFLVKSWSYSLRVSATFCLTKSESVMRMRLNVITAIKTIAPDWGHRNQIDLKKPNEVLSLQQRPTFIYHWSNKQTSPLPDNSSRGGHDGSATSTTVRQVIAITRTIKFRPFDDGS